MTVGPHPPSFFIFSYTNLGCYFYRLTHPLSRRNNKLWNSLSIQRFLWRTNIWIGLWTLVWSKFFLFAFCCWFIWDFILWWERCSQGDVVAFVWLLKERRFKIYSRRIDYTKRCGTRDRAVLLRWITWGLLQLEGWFIFHAECQVLTNNSKLYFQLHTWRTSTVDNNIIIIVFKFTRLWVVSKWNVRWESYSGN